MIGPTDLSQHEPANQNTEMKLRATGYQLQALPLAKGTGDPPRR